MAQGPRDLRTDDQDLLESYDPRSVERGVRYARQGRVTVLDVGPGWAHGEVQGTDATPYLVELDWSDSPRGVIIADECTCPLGGWCKHAVALIVTLADSDPSPTYPARTAGPGGSRPTAPDWRSALAGVVAAPAVDAAPMALEVHVEVPQPSRYSPDPSPQISLRPLRQGAKGKWVKTGASWRDVESGYAWNLHDASPEHLAALRSMLAGAEDARYLSASAPLAFGRFGPGVWGSLRQLVDAGVALVTADRRGTISIAAAPAHTTIDLTSAGDDVELSATISLDGRPLSEVPGRHVMTGSPPHGVIVIDGNDLRLVPLDATVHPGLVPLLGAAPLRIPADDIDELMDVYHPQLARVATIGSSDDSVTVEPTELDGIVAHVEHPVVGTATLRWTVRYRRGSRVSDHPLLVPVGASRDRAAEHALLDELELPTHLLATLVDVAGRPADLTVHGAEAVALLTQVAPWLEERGQVTVELSGEAPALRESTEDPLIALGVADSGDDDQRNDWFDLSVTVSVEGEPVEFARLFTALSLDEPVLVLDSGTWIRLDRPELARLRELIIEARGLAEPAHDTTIRINRFQASWWDDLAALGVVESQSRRWEQSVGRLRELTAPEPVTTPPGLDAELRHYQQEGLDWLAFLHRNGLGGILADDMGLGKTVQTLALFLHVLESTPGARFLVVAPTSVVQNWRREANRFAPGVDVATVAETSQRRGTGLADAVGDARIVVTSYALFRIDIDEYRSNDWDILVLDEAQFVKNHRSKTYQCVRRLDAPVKLAITGTPIENSLMDLWSLLSITAPGLYPDPGRFAEVYVRPIESGRAPELLATLRRRVAPLMRRRTKDEVLTELPPKTEQTVEIEPSPRHMRIYQSQLQRQRQKVLGLVDDVHKHRFEIFKSLTMLRQLSLDPALIDPAHDDVGSAKLDRLVEDLTEVVAEGHRALVFSQFTRFLARVRTRLDDAGIAHAYLDGRTRKREQAISAFKDGDVPVFVISLKAGGFGLNLTEADYCFVLDPWWNPASETQAVDRTHRIGQTNPVMVYRYVSSGTIEEKVMELKERKAAIFSAVMDADDRLSGALDADDIRALIDLPA